MREPPAVPKVRIHLLQRGVTNEPRGCWKHPILIVAPFPSSSPRYISDQEIKNRLESLGYTQVKDISPTPRGTSAKAMKGDKPVTVVVDSAGKIIDER
ncbi:MAG: hypothetical protein WA709_37405 [Stellaceae bacterium]